MPNMQEEVAAAVDGTLLAAINKPPDTLDSKAVAEGLIRSLRKAEKLSDFNVWKRGRVVQGTGRERQMG
jgi:hypothetical protein